MDVQREVDRFKQLPRLLHSGVTGSKFNQKLAQYKDDILGVYRCVLRETGASVILDSSKHPAYGAILASIPEIELTVVHVTRDSRAVAYSRKRKKKRPEIHWKDEYMAITPAWRTGVEWVLMNVGIELLKSRTRSLFMKYEDFVKEPRDATSYLEAELLRPLALSPETFERNAICLSTNHTVSGNPMRFATGAVEVARDDKWLSEMARFDRQIVSLLTWPLLSRYGYRINGVS